MKTVAILSLVVAAGLAVVILTDSTTTKQPGEATTPRQKFTTIGTGGVTGVYYPVGGAIARLVKQETGGKVRLSVDSTGGSVFNINNVVSGNIDLGFAQSDRLYHAVKGMSEWEGRPQTEVRFLFSLYPEVVTLVAAADKNIKSLNDLRGKVVNIGNPGSGQRHNAIELLAAVGLDYKKDLQAESLKAAECAKMLQDGRIDAYFYTVGHPAGSFKEVSAGQRQVRLVPIAGAAVEKWLASNSYFSPASIPVKEFYPSMANESATVQSVGMATTIITSAKQEDETIKQIMTAVFTNLEKLRQQHPAVKNLQAAAMCRQGKSAPYHPAALEYYQQAGFLAQEDK